MTVSLSAAQSQTVPLARQVSADEANRARAITSVPAATRKLQLLTEFLTAYPNSPLRGRLLNHVGVSISREPDAAIRVTLAEKLSSLVTSDMERTVAGEILAEAYLNAKRTDDAFQTVALLPSAEGLDVRLLVRLVYAGFDEVRQRNLKNLVVSQKYGDMAIRAIEADLSPGGMNAAGWADYKKKTLPSLHQWLGLLALHAGMTAEGLAHFQKALELVPDDPQNYIFFGAAINEDYARAAEQLKSMKPGPARDAQQKKVLEQMNQVVDAYAHAIALAMGGPLEQSVRAQVGPDLEGYYKFLHNGSLAGLQEYIEKFKKH